MYAVLGSGFGLYGYLPALLSGHSDYVILPESYKNKVISRPELNQYYSRIHWVNNEEAAILASEALVIARTPDKQFILVNSVLALKNIKRIVLEKPVARNPTQAEEIIHLLDERLKSYRISYSLLYTNWFNSLSWPRLSSEKSEITITWKFLAHHFAYDIHSWKRSHDLGGGVLRFYGIHIIALLSKLGYREVVSSKLMGQVNNEPESWSAIFVGNFLPNCHVFIDSRSDSKCFEITHKQYLEENFVVKLSDPFEEEESKDSNDIRVGVLTKILDEFKFEDTEFSQFYYEVNELWKKAETFSKTVDVWAVMGGRRWSRVIARELCLLLGPNAHVLLEDVSKDADLFAWWDTNPDKNRYEIIERIPFCPSPRVGIAIVANSAYLHCSSIESALDAGYNVISEKPLTFSQQESNRLISKAEKLGLKLFSTNTYLFASYLDVFRREWLTGTRYTHLHLDWADALSETRYGERKGYDSSVPIIYDVLPHVASIILAVHGSINPLQSIIKVHRGGSEVRLKFECDDLTITVNLARDSAQRKRLLHFSGEGSEVMIDFTEEPGKVSVGGGEMIITDPGWDSKLKPIAAMLYSAKQYFEKGTIDDRLGSTAALFGNKLIDQVADKYVDQQISFLNSEHSNAEDADFIYATKELTSLITRVVPHLPLDSPLKRLTMISQSTCKPT